MKCPACDSLLPPDSIQAIDHLVNCGMMRIDSGWVNKKAGNTETCKYYFCRCGYYGRGAKSVLGHVLKSHDWEQELFSELLKEMP